ncbi:MAG: hypothetical protein IJS78_03220 [Clostridia bacterium]|nr:hypothetical protein [Clostridia bacterium]
MFDIQKIADKIRAARIEKNRKTGDGSMSQSAVTGEKDTEPSPVFLFLTPQERIKKVEGGF